MRCLVFASMQLAAALLVAGSSLSAPRGRPDGIVFGTAPRLEHSTPIPAHARPPAPAGQGAVHRAPDAPGATGFPTFAWPLERALRVGLVAVNYVDHGPGSGLLDYWNGTHTYDTHSGTDYSLYDFRLMDRGCQIRAAAPGTVVFMDDPSPYDRNCSFPSPDAGNWIWIEHGDGSYGEYYHLRAFSRTVQLGEFVQAGQTLGLVGSSGYSTGPHLHFGTGDYSGPGATYVSRDPYNGPGNPLPSLWASQEPYALLQPFWFATLHPFTEAEVGGSVGNTSYCDVVRGLTQPVVYGANEAYIPLIAQFQGPANDSFAIEIRKPNGTLWAGFEDAFANPNQFNWFWAYWFWNGSVEPADFGTWKMRALVDGQLSIETPFVVGPTTVYPPRFWPRAGRSFRIDGTVQRDTLRRHPLSPGPVMYSLIGAPSFVSLLSDSIVEVGAISNQTTRSRYFQALMTDGAGRRDTAWYHVVDFSKPLDPVVSVEPELEAGRGLGIPAPNPFLDATRVRFSMARRGRALLTVHDLAGRRLRVLAQGEQPAGEHDASWDGRDGAGRSVAPGIYFLRLETDQDWDVRRVALLR